MLDLKKQLYCSILRLMLAIVLSAVPVYSCFAQYNSVNIDEATTAAITASFAANKAIETVNIEALDSIRKSYTRATLAVSGIFLTKRMEYRNLIRPGIFGSDETKHYQRIKELVAFKIIPKIYSVTGLCLEYPHQAYVWGPYMFKVCSDIYLYCMEYEQMVTNGQLSFKDISFPKFKEELESLFNLEKFGGVDWKSLITSISSFKGGSYNVDSIKDLLKGDFNDIVSMGKEVIGTAGNFVDSAFNKNSGSAFEKLFSFKTDSIMQAVDRFMDVYKMFNDSVNVTNILKRVTDVIDSSSVKNLFKIRPYNLDSFKVEYGSKDADQKYFRQRYYIVSKNAEYEKTVSVICDYTHKNDVIGSDTEARRQELIMKAQNACGWSRERVEQLNEHFDPESNNPQYRCWYEIFINVSSQPMILDNMYWLMCNIKVEETRYTSNGGEEIVYEAVYDSQEGNEAEFIKDINYKLGDYQAAYPQKHFELKKEDPKYYTASSESTMSGCYAVTFLANCTEGSKLGAGQFEFKVQPKHNPLNEDSKRYCMETTISNDGSEVQELDNAISSKQKEIDNLNNEISQLQNEINELYKKLDFQNASSVQNQIDKKDELLKQKKSQLQQKQTELQQLQENREEAYTEYVSEEDEAERIPAVMRRYEVAYGLQWQDQGSWHGWTFVRRAYLPNANGYVNFTATISRVRGEKYFLFWRIRRSIIRVEYSITSSVSSSDVIDIMQFDTDTSAKERSEKVNKRLSELMSENPGCEIKVQYESPVSVEEEEENHKVHMLWYSDRLRLAIQIENRLNKIYAELLLCEKWLRSHVTLKQYLVAKALEPIVRAKREAHSNESLRRWRYAATIGSGMGTAYKEEDDE